MLQARHRPRRRRRRWHRLRRPPPLLRRLPPGHNGTGTYTITKVWDRVTTYCPEPTTLYYNNRTYTIDGPTTLIIPDCPCTQTYSCPSPRSRPRDGPLRCHLGSVFDEASPLSTARERRVGMLREEALLTCPAPLDHPPHGRLQAPELRPPRPARPDRQRRRGGYGTYQLYSPGQSGAAGAPGTTPTTPGQNPGGTPAVVVTAGAERRAAAAAVAALAAGVAAALAL
ncbi:LOW QUALITY PROTEIN: cell wall protein [Colletotrichum tofieldiae]|nr:LOW QUALITY PROTEIN: cell wall protein [Colletotrichum tofieldiae]